MSFNFNIYALIVLVISAVLGYGGGFLAKKITDDEQKQTTIKIITKSAAMIGVIAALIITIYL